MKERIERYRMFYKGGASQLVQLMSCHVTSCRVASNEDLLGPEDVNEDIRELM